MRHTLDERSADVPIRIPLHQIALVLFDDFLLERRHHLDDLERQVTDREALLAGLKRATGYVRGELGRRLKLKYTPSIEFYFDDSFDKQERIFNLLEHIQHEHEEGTSE